MRQYDLIHFDKSAKNGLDEAIYIYSSYIDYELKTNSQEILYWIDNYDKKFENQSLYCLGFEFNGKIIGYTEFVHLRDKDLIIVDYLIIEKKFRSLDMVATFIALIHDFINIKQLRYSFIVTEIGWLSEKEAPATRSQALVKLLKMNGFKVVKAPFFQPSLNVKLPNHKEKSILMIFTNNETNQLSQQQFFDIVYDIYFRHYLLWYSYDSQNITEYKNQLEELYEEVKSKAPKVVKINGSHYTYSEVDTQSMTQYQQLKKQTLIGLITLSFILFIGYLFITHVKMNLINIAFIFLLVLVYFGIMSLVSKDAKDIFHSFIKFFPIFFEKIESDSKKN